MIMGKITDKFMIKFMIKFTHFLVTVWGPSDVNNTQIPRCLDVF